MVGYAIVKDQVKGGIPPFTCIRNENRVLTATLVKNPSSVVLQKSRTGKGHKKNRGIPFWNTPALLCALIEDISQSTQRMLLAVVDRLLFESRPLSTPTLRMILDHKELEDAPVRGRELLKRLRYLLAKRCAAQELLRIASRGAKLREVFKSIVYPADQTAKLYFVGVKTLVIFLDIPRSAAVAVIDRLRHLHIVVCSGGGIVDVP